ncbi:abortive infection AbiH-like protein [Alteromonas sp. I10]|uniref:bacteriophage abortive infection AbiH family protein n=1 Tax=Alteromonas TaxID=226 RepID=UPI000D75A702|nr:MULTISPECIES: bacteriophage abortive infection AbiH family protein [Alteromonas]MCZ4239036.1 bacteriophage abortive infection AbiH family protein [Alteromonas macleodii]PXW73616.1 abortive infection AbiH-like protein [Alteromonas sp. I10]
MKLYVIGNGFDLHHGLNTSYSSFGLFLKKHYSDVYELLLEHYGFEDINSENQSVIRDLLWSDFEHSLSLLDTQTVLDAYTDYLANPSSDDFRDRDWGAFQIEMEFVLEKLTATLFSAFKEFILSVEFPKLDQLKEIKLNKKARYLTFNYTDTLSRYYSISDENVLFIHGKVDGRVDELVLGHGVNPDSFIEKPESPPEGLFSENLEAWYEHMSDQFDYSYELGKETINRYFNETFKCTESIISSNAMFFRNLKNIDEVIVIGHSLADVDMPYFKHLANSTKHSTNWTVTFHDESDRNTHFSKLTNLGIKNISVVRMSAL